MDADAAWHVDKKIPIALIVTIVLAILGQTIAGTVWITRIDTKVDNTITRVEILERSKEAAALAAQPQTERLIRVETKVDAMHEDINAIKQALSPSHPH